MSQMLKATGIAGSPRKSGNSTTLLKAVLTGAGSAGAETQIIRLNDLAFRGCQACAECAAGGQCVLTDELTPVFTALRDSHVWVLASPIYYDSVTGQMKTFFDRCRWLTMEGDRLKPRLSGKRRAAVIVTYEDKPRKDYPHEAEKLAYYLSWMGDFGEVEAICEGRLGPADAAANRPDLLERAEVLGKRLVQDLAGV